MSDLRPLEQRPRVHAGLAGPAAHVDLELPAGRRIRGWEVGQADAPLERRREGAARDDAAAEHAVARSRDAAPLDDERHELLRGPGGARRGDRLGADVAVAATARPAEPGLDRPALLA